MSDEQPASAVNQVESWDARARRVFGSSRVVEHAIELIGRLEALTQWASEDEPMRWLLLLRLGVLFSYTRRIEGAIDFQESLATGIARADAPPPDDLAELNALALCISLGATDGARIRRTKGRTADWRLHFQGVAEWTIDVEVTRARRKDEYVRRQVAAEGLTDRLYGLLGESSDLVIHIVEPAVQAHCDAVVAAVQSMGHGEQIGAWQARREPISREVGAVVPTTLDAEPHWWPRDRGKAFNAVGTLPVHGATASPPQLRVIFGVPYTAYINPIMKKADAPQGAKQHSFLLVVEVDELTSAFEELPRAVSGYLPHWSAVSGILLYRNFSDLDTSRIGWRWRFIVNPYARQPLPDPLLNLASRFDGRLAEIAISLK